ncbi:MAG: TonB-dependent receptor [Pseudomonadota bacterium]|nr:TonB-dependent receptor [Pseudomonadota bacterium]
MLERCARPMGLLPILPIAMLAATSVATAADTLEEVVVFARGEQQIGRAAAASEGAVGGADLSVRPLLRVAELLEVVPGMIAVQHSGSGKANQYFLRGFNLDHGTDFSNSIDDVPMNLRSHGHGQGYLDVNGLIPEVIERIDYRKGPYRADTGDFSMAGAAHMSTVSRLDTFLAAEGGKYDWQRLAGGASTELGAGELVAVGEWKSYDGPWELAEDLRHQAAWAKYSLPMDGMRLEVSLSGYHAEWRPTEQIPERAIGTEACANAYCSLDPTAVGETLRWIAAARLIGEDWRATAYAQYYDWNMLSNATYDFQINQFDRRWIGGGRFERAFTVNDELSLTAGVEARHDDIGNVGLQHTEAGALVATISQHSVRESSAGVYTEATWRPVDGLRLTGGLRGDYYDFDVKARIDGIDAGSDSDSAVSPKLGAAYSINDRVEVYGNWGKGFHSNDARGVVNTVTPVAGLSDGSGQELGARFELGPVRLTATYWWLELDSELKFVGDSNSVEPGAATKRRGYELVGFWRPLDWLALDASWTGSRARYENSPDGAYVAGAVENAGELGIAMVHDRWEASLRVRHLGEYPLIEDNSLRADAETSLNLRGAWKAEHFTVYAELLNALDEDGKDIVYYYGAHVAGLDPDGEQVDGRVSRVQEPRTLRFGVKYNF